MPAANDAYPSERSSLIRPPLPTEDGPPKNSLGNSKYVGDAEVNEVSSCRLALILGSIWVR